MSLLNYTPDERDLTRAAKIQSLMQYRRFAKMTRPVTLLDVEYELYFNSWPNTVSFDGFRRWLEDSRRGYTEDEARAVYDWYNS